MSSQGNRVKNNQDVRMELKGWKFYQNCSKDDLFKYGYSTPCGKPKNGYAFLNGTYDRNGRMYFMGDVAIYKKEIICCPNYKPKNEKPPLGLTPKKFKDEERFKEVYEAVKRYVDANMLVPEEWTHELHELNQKLNK